MIVIAIDEKNCKEKVKGRCTGTCVCVVTVAVQEVAIVIGEGGVLV